MANSFSTLEIKRYPEYFGTTLGELWLDSNRVAYTLELPWKDNQHDISCIPLGTFELQLTFSEKFNAIRPLIIVPGRDGVRMHAANRVSELEGCIAPVRRLYIEDRIVFGGVSGLALEDLMRWIRAHNITQLIVSQI